MSYNPDDAHSCEPYGRVDWNSYDKEDFFIATSGLISDRTALRHEVARLEEALRAANGQSTIPPMTDKEKTASNWSLDCPHSSVAARYAIILANYIKRALPPLGPPVKPVAKRKDKKP